MTINYSIKKPEAIFLFFFILNAFSVFSQNNEIATQFKNANGPSPYVLWQWMNGCVTKEGITSDLEAYKKVGIKNVQQFLIGGSEADITDPNINVLGDKWIDLMKFSLDECERLGMDFGTHNCPGWSSSGAPGIEAEDSMQKLVWSKTTVTGKLSKGTTLPKAEIDTKWNYYRDICLIAIPKGDAILKKENIIVLTDAIDSANKLKKALPQGEWVVLRFGHTTTGHMNLTAPVSGQGLEVDKFSRKALDKFWALYPAKLMELAGKHAGKSFKRIEIDSYEAGSQDWTLLMPEEFKQRRGYDLYPWLSVIAGYTVESENVSKRFKNDWQRTINELFADNYYGYLEELVHKTPGMEFLVEPYGTGKKNFDDTSIRGIGDIYMCEFWTKPATWGWDSILPVSSNAHVNSKKVVAAEAFTGQPQYAFQNDFNDLKATGDQAFCEGVNLFVLHASAHQPWPNLKPGMVMGWWGTQFGPGQTWWDHGAAEWIEYVTRCQLLLQKGLFVGDVCYLQLQRQKNTAIPEGFRADICSEKELLTRFKVKDNTLTLADGMSYRILILPNQPKIEPELARKIETLVNEGAIVVGNGFTGSSGLNNYETRNKEVLDISERLFGSFESNNKLKKQLLKIGKGKVYVGYSAEEVLALENIAKDVEVLNNKENIAWIHRNDGNENYYFVSNKSKDKITTNISFRVEDMQPEIWNPVTGEIKNALIWETKNGRTNVNFNLEANGSCFIVFRNQINNQTAAIKNLSINGIDENIGTYLSNKNELILNKKGTYSLSLQNDRTVTLKQKQNEEAILLNENWEVQFEENRGAPVSAHFDKLISWPLHTDLGIKFFSGTAKYKKSFRLNSKQLKSNKRILVDLGEVKNIATVMVNGKTAQLIWKAPFVADITEFCTTGENQLEVKVTNLWPNRIIGDKLEPEDCLWGPMRTFTYVDPNIPIGRNLLEVPDWVKNNTPRPSKNRITFCTMDFFEKDTPLLPSGLIGPVQILIQDIWNVK